MLQRRVPRAEERRRSRAHLQLDRAARPSSAAAGLDVTGSHHAHALHSPYWWLKCAVGPQTTTTRGQTYRRFLEWDIIEQPRSTQVAERVLSPVLGKSIVFYAHARHATERRHRPDAVTCPTCRGALRRRGPRDRRTSRLVAARHGMIPWFPGGHCDPWNHVETAMALDVAGFHHEAERGLRVAGRHPARRRQLVATTTSPTGPSRTPSSTPTCARTSPPACGTTGCCTWDRGFVDHLWPTVERALEWVLATASPRRHRAVGRRADDRRGTTR